MQIGPWYGYSGPQHALLVLENCVFDNKEDSFSWEEEEQEEGRGQEGAENASCCKHFPAQCFHYRASHWDSQWSWSLHISIDPLSHESTEVRCLMTHMTSSMMTCDVPTVDEVGPMPGSIWQTPSCGSRKSMSKWCRRNGMIWCVAGFIHVESQLLSVFMPQLVFDRQWRCTDNRLLPCSLCQYIGNGSS